MIKEREGDSDGRTMAEAGHEPTPFGPTKESAARSTPQDRGQRGHKRRYDLGGKRAPTKAPKPRIDHGWHWSVSRSAIEKTRGGPSGHRIQGRDATVRLLARVIGIGIETADMLVHEILSRNLRDRRAVARYAGLTGSPDESGLKRREKGLAKAGNARVRRGLIQLAWRFLMFQKDSALAQWYRTRTEGPSGARKTTMIVALARKLLIALWRLVTTGEVPDGVELRPA